MWNDKDERRKKHVGLFKRERKQGEAADILPAPVQMRAGNRHPFQLIDGYIPLHRPEFSLYRSIREAIPVVDAAILKLIRLTGGVEVVCQDKGAQVELNEFLRTVPVGWNQRGIQAFLDGYLDCLLTCGRAVGEIVPSRDGREIAAVLCGDVSDIQVKETGSPLEVLLARRGEDGGPRCCPGRTCSSSPPTTPAPRSPMGCHCFTVCPFWRGCC